MLQLTWKLEKASRIAVEQKGLCKVRCIQVPGSRESFIVSDQSSRLRLNLLLTYLAQVAHPPQWYERWISASEPVTWVAKSNVQRPTPSCLTVLGTCNNC